MSGKRSIAVVTGSRADYGLLRPLMEAIRDSDKLHLQTIVTGMHLAPAFGSTVEEIRADGFTIGASVDMLLAADTPVAVAKSIGLGVIGFADALERLRPDLLLLLGDRFEILAAAQAAMVARIPIAHLHGGELTEGLIDEAIRHSLTKMAQLHFTAAEPYRRRVIQLGEEPARVFNVGATGIEALRRLSILDRSELESSLGFVFGTPTFLVTYHPVTLASRSPMESMGELLDALDAFPEARIIFTGTNADTHGHGIHTRITRYQAAHPQRVALFSSLGQRRYLSAVRYADAVIGNSSSAVIEVPAIGTPTVNIGPRQRGRIHPPSVIDCEERSDSIIAAIHKALSPDHRALARECRHPYGDGHVAEKIVRVLTDVPLEGLIMKPFHDIGTPG